MERRFSRRTFFTIGAITAAGLALPATDILADAEEVVRQYWALDQTHLEPVAPSHASIDGPRPSHWWNLARIVSENRSYTLLAVNPASTPLGSFPRIALGDQIAIGEYPAGSRGITGLARQSVVVRHIDRERGIITVTTPQGYTPMSYVPYGKL